MSLVERAKLTTDPIFFTKQELTNHLHLEQWQIHHLRVRRQLCEDQKIFLSNQKNVALSQIKIQSQKKVYIEIIEQEQLPTRQHKVTLLASPIKQELYRLILQKSVEIGVDCITPLITKFTQKKDFIKRTDNLEKIIELACHQSRQLQCPTLNNPIKIADLKLISGDKKEYRDEEFHQIFVADWKSEKRSLPDQKLNPYDRVALLVGPEGGWCQQEIDTLPQHHKVLLSNNILRTETACILLCAKALDWVGSHE